LVVDLSYGHSGSRDRFDWQLFDPAGLKAMAARCGWHLRLACTDFDAGQPPAPDRPRVQYVLERAAT
jgi:hypothetical protein